MRKILSLLTGVSLITCGTSTAIACGFLTAQAKKESNELNGKTITLNDPACVKYEGKTAQDDVSIIDKALEQKGYIDSSDANDFHFDNTRTLTVGMNKDIAYRVKAADHSIAAGHFNIDIKHPDMSIGVIK